MYVYVCVCMKARALHNPYQYLCADINNYINLNGLTSQRMLL